MKDSKRKSTPAINRENTIEKIVTTHNKRCASLKGVQVTFSVSSVYDSLI